jgi:tripartite ATP-independent transporter DctP family solute receptor
MTGHLPIAALGLGALATSCVAEGQRVRVIRASSSSAVNEPSVQALERFGEELAARSNGRFRVEVYANNALGNEREVIELAIIGAVELTCPSNAPLATFVPELLVFDLPYLFRDRAHMYAVLDGEIGQSFARPLARRELRLLGYFDVGLRHLMTRGPVNRLTDLGGLKIRTMENPLHLAAFRAFGASPLPMAYGEVYTALEQGVIDGAEASSTNYYAKRFHEVAPHWTEIGWMYLVSPLVMSERFYSGLEPADQEMIRAAAARAIAWEREEYERQEREAETELEAAGVRMVRPDASALREAARRVWRQSRDRVDLNLVEAIVNTP